MELFCLHSGELAIKDPSQVAVQVPKAQGQTTISDLRIQEAAIRDRNRLDPVAAPSPDQHGKTRLYQNPVEENHQA